MHAARCWVLALLPGLLAGGCGVAPPGSSAPAGGAGETVVVEVENESSRNLTIYTMQSGEETRLGRVASMRTESFRVPAARLGSSSVQLVARPVGAVSGAGSLLSGPFPVASGQAVRWRLSGRPGVSNLPRQVSLHIF